MRGDKAQALTQQVGENSISMADGVLGDGGYGQTMSLFAATCMHDTREEKRVTVVTEQACLFITIERRMTWRLILGLATLSLLAESSMNSGKNKDELLK